jgi:hypothetical protein
MRLHTALPAGSDQSKYERYGLVQLYSAQPPQPRAIHVPRSLLYALTFS